jgi:hypothetical protein
VHDRDVLRRVGVDDHPHRLPMISPAVLNAIDVAVALLNATSLFAGAVTVIAPAASAQNVASQPGDTLARAGRVKFTVPPAPWVVNVVRLSAATTV